MYQKIIIVLIVINIPIFIKLFKIMFPSRFDFMESLRYATTHNMVSLFRGQYTNDRIAESRLSLFLLMSSGLIGLELVMIFLGIKIYSTYI